MFDQPNKFLNAVRNRREPNPLELRRREEGAQLESQQPSAFCRQGSHGFLERLDHGRMDESRFCGAAVLQRAQDELVILG